MKKLSGSDTKYGSISRSSVHNLNWTPSTLSGLMNIWMNIHYVRLYLNSNSIRYKERNKMDPDPDPSIS